MPTILIMSIFSFLAALMATIVLGSSISRQEFTQALIKENKEYFNAIRTLVMKDMVPNNLDVTFEAGMATTTPATAGEALISQTVITRLGVPNALNDPTRDVWGTKLVMHVVRAPTAFDENTIAPVKGILLLSAGPDLTVQTNVTVSETLLGYQTITPPAGSDDILMFFTTEEPLKVAYNQMVESLNKIKDVIEQDYGQRVAKYSRDNGLTGTSLRDALQTNPAAPQFIEIGAGNPTEARRLGVDQAIEELERILPTNGRMRVRTIGAIQPGVMTFGLTQDTSNPTSWGQLGPRVTARASF